jgi:hypothetical protein
VCFHVYDAHIIQANAEYQQLRWMRLAILKRRKAGDSALLDGKPISEFYSVRSTKPIWDMRNV